jgi:hypothetical protein
MSGETDVADGQVHTLMADGPSGPMLARHDHEHTFADGKRVPILTLVVSPAAARAQDRP